ncbi:CBS domain-containing protein, partial [Streptosporangiaceae bacterium NEAU-GS5]|nr:CBS domain-containing protein [Streptosporangiaceae bacterium NEAU-GS5]
MSVEVKDVMGRVAIAVRQDAGFTEILDAMRRYAVGAVTVIDADRRPVGVVSEDDLLVKETHPRRPGLRKKAAAVLAGELMTSPAITITPGTPVRTAARLMLAGKIKQLPVIDPVTGRIIGTLHQGDVLRVFTRPAGELVADITAVLREQTDVDPEALVFTADRGVVGVGGTVERSSQVRRIADAIGEVDGVVDVVFDLTVS